MSSLSYIRDPIPLLLVGGISGIGKTSILDSLLSEFPEWFQQPLSYTSRKQRGESDRYIFASKDEIAALFEKGDLLNLDEAYGHLYGMARGSVLEIRRSGRIPVKEVHPSNFRKIKDSDPSTITAVIENKHLSDKSDRWTERVGREGDEEDWLSEPGDLDVVLNVAGLSPSQAARFLIKKLFAFRRHEGRLTHPELIDHMNTRGYTAIAREFNEARRITTRNFHDASRPFWISFFDDHFVEGNPRTNLLEIGPGNGWLLSTFGIPAANIYGVDIAPDMKAEYLDYKSVSSARSMPFRAEFFSYILASLADPYLYPEVIIEVGRLLKPGGLFAMTYPSSFWANHLMARRDKDKTVFINELNQPIEVYSICQRMVDLYEVFRIADLQALVTVELYLPEDYVGEVASAISESALSAGRDVFSMPIVIGGIFKKGKTDAII